MGVITTKLDAEWAEKQVDENMFTVMHRLIGT